MKNKKTLIKTAGLTLAVLLYGACLVPASLAQQPASNPFLDSIKNSPASKAKTETLKNQVKEYKKPETIEPIKPKTLISKEQRKKGAYFLKDLATIAVIFIIAAFILTLTKHKTLNLLLYSFTLTIAICYQIIVMFVFTNLDEKAYHLSEIFSLIPMLNEYLTYFIRGSFTINVPHPGGIFLFFVLFGAPFFMAKFLGKSIFQNPKVDFHIGYKAWLYLLWFFLFFPLIYFLFISWVILPAVG